MWGNGVGRRRSNLHAVPRPRQFEPSEPRGSTSRVMPLPLSGTTPVEADAAVGEEDDLPTLRWSPLLRGGGRGRGAAGQQVQHPTYHADGEDSGLERGRPAVVDPQRGVEREWPVSGEGERDRDGGVEQRDLDAVGRGKEPVLPVDAARG